MTNEQTSQLPTGVARSAFVAGLISIALLGVYLFTPSGPTLLFGCILVGLVAIALGTLALKRNQFRGIAITGIVLGALGLITGAAIFGFALLFVGAIG